MPGLDFAMVVLAGGDARRLDGVDKASVTVGRTTLLERVLSAGAGAKRTIVVGPPRALPAGVWATREDPPGGGPVAALEAGLALVDEPVVVVLACDMPLVSASTVKHLVNALDQSLTPPEVSPWSAPDGAKPIDAVALIDDGRRRQPLAASYRTAPLRAALTALPTTRDASMRALTHLLTVGELAIDPEQTLDCDTWADVQRTRKILEES
ncbi:MAG: molybdenum cofactor guanylyltransferase [Nocardioidaceae bacterium]